MQRILVAVDQSSAAQSALVWAHGLASAQHAELLVVNVLEPPYAEVSPKNHQMLLAERQRLLDTSWTACLGAHNTVLRTLVRQGNPPRVLLQVAASANADLIVLGRPARGARPGFGHFSSIAEYCAHHSELPLAVIPEGTTTVPGHIVVGVDGSHRALQAATWSADLAQAINATLTAIAIDVVDTSSTEHPTPTDPGPKEQRMHTRIARWAAPLAGIGARVQMLTRPGTQPADGLLAAVEQLDADLLVVGARGVGGVTGVRLGGTTIRSLHEASVAFVMVPTGPRPSAEDHQS